MYAQDNYKKFSKNFQETFSELLLESHLMLMFSRKTAFVGSKCLNFVIKYVSSATKLERTMSKLKPFIDNILYETVIPIMLPTMKDIALFSEDPIEYIRKQQDFTETLYMPKNTVIDLLQYIVMKFRQPTMRSPREKGSKRVPILQTLMIVVEMQTANTD